MSCSCDAPEKGATRVSVCVDTSGALDRADVGAPLEAPTFPIARSRTGSVLSRSKPWTGEAARKCGVIPRKGFVFGEAAWVVEVVGLAAAMVVDPITGSAATMLAQKIQLVSRPTFTYHASIPMLVIPRCRHSVTPDLENDRPS